MGEKEYNIFISWSEERSRRIAELFKDWIQPVMQNLHPWISTHDLSKGTFFMAEIGDTLSISKFGLVFVTPENKNNNWLLFESGAIYKGLSKNRIFTFLIDIKHTEIEKPLSELNHTIFNKEDILKLLKDINQCLSENKRLDERILEQSFKTHWSTFEQEYNKILQEEKDKIKDPIVPRTTNEMIDEILTTVRKSEKKIDNIESYSDLTRFVPLPPNPYPGYHEHRTNESILRQIISEFKSGMSLSLIIKKFDDNGYPRVQIRDKVIQLLEWGELTRD